MEIQGALLHKEFPRSSDNHLPSDLQSTHLSRLLPDHKSISVTKWKGEEEINGDKGEMRVYYTINKINTIKRKTRKHKSCSHCYYH